MVMNNIGAIMTETVVTGRGEDTLQQARRVMLTEGIQSLPIIDDGGKVLGMVTSSDLLSELPGEVSLAEIMATEVVYVSPDDPLPRAAQLMRDHDIHHVVVVQDGCIVGIVSAFDLIKQYM
jgi:CBS domain-containing protein